MEERKRFNILGYPPGTELYRQMVKERKTYVYTEESDQALQEVKQQFRQAMTEDMVMAGIRWCSNILVELLGNYGHRMPPKARELMRQGTALLHEAQAELRKA